MAVAAIGATLAAPPTRAAGEVSANGTSRVIAVAPVSGGLSLEVGLGSAIADLEGTTPRAESATLKPGILGLLAGSTVPLPKPSKADLRAEREVDSTSVAPPLDLGLVRLTSTRERAAVTADDAEEGLGATARTDLSDVEIAGLVDVAGGTATAAASAKQAESTSSIGRLTVALAGVPLVDLRGLEWRVVSELGEKPQVGFSVASAVIQGDRQSIESPAELAAALEPLQPLLAPAGLSISVPTVEELEGGASLSPLVVQSLNAELLRSTVGGVYPQIAPIYNELATQLQGQVAEAGLALLVVNVGLSIAAGNGGARVAVGGASATITPRESFGSVDGGAGGGDGGVLAEQGSGSADAAGSSSPTTGGSFFDDSPAERTSGVSTASPLSPSTSGRSSGASRSTTAEGVELSTAPLVDEGSSSVPAALVLAAVLAGVTALAARDQMNVRRRDALRQARARSLGSL